MGEQKISKSGKNLQPRLNEAINFNKKAIFIAVPKTGTTTVRKQMRQRGKGEWLISNPHLDIIQVRDLIDFHFMRQSLGGNRKFPTVSVMSTAEARSKSREVFASFFKFAAVRNPWARAVSLYFRREGIKVADSISFDEFCENMRYANDTCFHPTRHSDQMAWLVDENENLLVDYVYRLDRLKEADREIRERSGGRVSIDFDNRANVNDASKARDYKDMFNPHTRNLIGDLYKRDIEQFGFDF